MRDLPQVLEGLGSPDAPTRRMARLFLLSCVLFLGTLGVGFVYYLTPDPTKPKELTYVERDAKTFSDFVQKQVDLTRHRATFLQLGSFTIELKPIAGSIPGRGVLNLAEIELFVQCDSIETRNYLFQHQVRVRDRVTHMMPLMDREELISREGKKKLKARIVKGLNEFLPQGQVQEAFFSKLLIN